MLPDDFRFEDPILLLLAAVIPLVFLWEYWRASRRPALTYSNVAALDAPPGLRVRLRWLPTFLRALALALVVIALARPQSGEAEALAPTEGIDIVLAIDVSASMQQEDFGGRRRVDGAKEVAAEFVGERDTDRVGVVGFRRHSLILSPLTVDYAAVQAIISRADSVNLEDGTGIGVAIAESANLLRDSRATSRVVVLLTDGENNEPLDPADRGGAHRSGARHPGLHDRYPVGAARAFAGRARGRPRRAGGGIGSHRREVLLGARPRHPGQHL